jgi:hypothetical protein
MIREYCKTFFEVDRWDLSLVFEKGKAQEKAMKASARSDLVRLSMDCVLYTVSRANNNRCVAAR